MELVIHRDKLESSTERERERKRKRERKGRSGAERREMFGRRNKKNKERPNPQGNVV